ncbi:chaperonin-containing T-complex alpha subunit Cct1 [Coemansia sp. RSA 2524]|nr:chaperonin-containing T-complex alpha subunit Cct1 [Coemansia sp. RSA 2524]
MFAEAGAVTVTRVPKDDARRIARGCGASVLTTLATLDGDEAVDVGALGSAELVEQVRLSDDDVVVVRGAREQHAATVILRGANDYMLDEMERSFHDSLCAVKRVLESGSVVPGGGAVEVALDIYLESFATTLGSREQLAIVEFANALLSIPKQLAVNAAKDSIELVAKLRAYHAAAQNAAPDAPRSHLKNYGLDLHEGKLRDNVKAGVLEPAMSKIKMLKSATEAAINILRIDDMIKLVPEQQAEDPHAHIQNFLMLLYETDGNMQAQIILNKIILAGESYLGRLREYDQLAQFSEDTGANEVAAEDRHIDAGAQGEVVTRAVGAPLPLRDQRLSLEERRLALEERKQAYEIRKNAKETVDQARVIYNAEMDAYRDFLNAAGSVRNVPPVESGNIFCSLQVFYGNASESNHECRVAEYRYSFFRSNDLLPLARKFQAICMRNTQVGTYRVDDAAPVANRSEQAFTNQVVREMAPRLRVILEEVVGIRNVHIQTLHKNSGVDIGLTAFSSDRGKLLFYLPIEVKNVFGLEDGPENIPEKNSQNYIDNRDRLRTLHCHDPPLKTEALWHAFTQTAHYMMNDMPQTNYGVVIAKNAMFLLWRVDSEKILISDGVSYTSTDPHPAAIISFFVAYMLRHSTAANIPGLNPELHLLENATDSIGGFSTAYESAEDVKSKLKEAIDPLDFTKRSLDLACMNLSHFLTSRCSVFYGTWYDGQPVAVKSAPMDNAELFEEISNELAVYMRLKVLQGVNIPRLIEYGCAYIDNEKCAVLVIERINEPSLMDKSVKLDERPAFKQLSILEKTACFNVLEKIHRCGIAHNDIRGANILFRTTGNCRYVPVFIDFGFAQWADRMDNFNWYRDRDFTALVDIFIINKNDEGFEQFF